MSEKNCFYSAKGQLGKHFSVYCSTKFKFPGSQETNIIRENVQNFILKITNMAERSWERERGTSWILILELYCKHTYVLYTRMKYTHRVYHIHSPISSYKYWKKNGLSYYLLFIILLGLWLYWIEILHQNLLKKIHILNL